MTIHAPRITEEYDFDARVRRLGVTDELLIAEARGVDYAIRSTNENLHRQVGELPREENEKMARAKKAQYPQIIYVWRDDDNEGCLIADDNIRGLSVSDQEKIVGVYKLERVAKIVAPSKLV